MNTTETERKYWRDSPADMVRRLTRDADRLAAIERKYLFRTNEMPEWAIEWVKKANGRCYYSNNGGGLDHPYWSTSTAPDYRQGEEGPLSLPILDPLEGD